MPNPVIEAKATGPQIEALVDKLVFTLDGSERHHAIIALTTLALILMKPDITPDQIEDGVKGVTGYICTLLSHTDERERLVVN